MGPRILAGTVVIFVAGAALFYLKYSVEQQEIRLAEMRTQYLLDQKALRVLKAEWTYLNSPQYLQNLARRYLTLRPMAPTQALSWYNDLPGYVEAAPPRVASHFQSAQDVIKASLTPERDNEP